MNIPSLNLDDFDPFALPFVLAREKSKLPSTAGIYFAIGGPRTILYIGSSNNIKARWQNHNVYIFLAMSMIDARIAYLALPNQSRLHVLEKTLIKYFNPILNIAGSAKGGRLNVLDALDRLNEMDELYSTTKEAPVDRVSTAYLLKRYDLRSRTALLNRISALEIKPVREGNRFFVSVEGMDKLDALDKCLKEGNSLTECAVEVKTGLFSQPNSDEMDNGFSPMREESVGSVAKIPTNFLALQLPEELIEIMRSFLDAKTEPDLFANHDLLAKAARENYHLSTSALLPLVGLKSVPQLDAHNRFRRMGFNFWKIGRAGRESEWKISKESA